MQKRYSTTEQFIIRFYHAFKAERKAQQLLVTNKEWAKAASENLNKNWGRG